MTKYRIVTDGRGYKVQAKCLWWWGRAFYFRNWFESVEIAEQAVNQALANEKNDGHVVKEISGP